MKKNQRGSFYRWLFFTLFFLFKTIFCLGRNQREAEEEPGSPLAGQRQDEVSVGVAERI